MNFPVTSTRFEYRARLGSGGMGVVYRAWDRKRNSLVALKTLTRLDPESIQRFKNEFRSLSDLTHPNLVCLYELFNEEALWYFTMEYIPGSDFLHAVCPQAIFDNANSPTEDSADPDATVMMDPVFQPAENGRLARPQDRGPCDYDLLRSLTLQIGLGLNVIHAHGKLHCDMKPSNVSVTSDGRAVILDFGLVSDLYRRSGEEPGCEIVGTPHYMAPEQITGQALTPATDWYALGVMLYVALVGHTPHTGTLSEMVFQKQHTTPPEPLSFFDDIPGDLNELCVNLLSVNPAERPDAAEIARQLGGTKAVQSETASSFLPSFVGRREQLAILNELAKKSEGGETAIASLSGDSGVGKSTLVGEFLRQVNTEALVWQGRCYEQESMPYKALDVIVDALSRYLRTLDSNQLNEVVSDQFDSLGRLFPLLHPFARGRFAGETSDKTQTRRLAINAFKELLRRIARKRALIIHLDDLQWGDRDSGQMLEELLRPPAVPRLMLILSSRPEGAHTSELLTVLKPYLTAPEKYGLTMRRIQLEPLPEHEARALTAGLMKGITSADAATIARGSGGNPFFIIEMTRSFVRGKANTAATTLDGLIWSRTQNLPAAARKLLEVIAVSGKPLTSFDAFSAAGLEGADPRILSLLRNEHLIRNIGASDELMDTYHDRVRESIVAALPADIKLAHHHEIASALIASSAQDPEAIGFHLESSGATLKALDYYLTAAQQSAAVLAFDNGVRLLRHCIQLQGESASRDLQLRLAEMLANAGNGLEAARLYEQLLPGSTAEQAAELERKAAYHYCAAGYLDEGREIARRTLARAGMSLPGSRLSAIARLSVDRVRFRLRGIGFEEKPGAAVAAQLLNRVDTAFDVVESLGMVDMFPAMAIATRGLFYALETGDPMRVARAFSICASQLAADGDAAQARRAYAMIRVCQRIATRFDEPLLWAYYQMALGFAAINQGRYAAPFQHFQEAESYFQKSPGKAWNVATCRSLYLDAARTLGLINTLADRSRRFLREAEDRGDLFMATNIGCSALPSALLYQGQPQEAIATTRHWLSQWKPKGLHYQHSISGFGVVWGELHQGNAAAAYAEAKKSWIILSRSLLDRMNSFRHVYLDCLGTACLAFCRASNNDKALLAEATHVRNRLLRERYRAAHASAAVIEAGIAAIRGDEAGAVQGLKRGLGILEGLQMNLHAHSVRLRLAELVGGDEGRSQVRMVEEWASVEGVRDLNGLKRVYTGGFKE